MKKILVIAAIVATLWTETWACECTCSSQSSCTNSAPKKFAIRRIPMSQFSTPTNVVVASAAPNITTNFSQPIVVQQPVIVQPVVVQEPIVVQQPVYVERVYSTPGRIGIVNVPAVASVGVSISSYPSYNNTGTYWVNDSACDERARIRDNRMGYQYGFGGHRSYSPNYNNNPYGSVPSVGQMFNHGGGRRH